MAPEMAKILEAGIKWLHGCIDESWTKAFEQNIQFQKKICWSEQEDTKLMEPQENFI